MANDDSTATKSSSSNSICFPPDLPWLIKLQVRLVHIFFYAIIRSNTSVNRPLINLLVRKTPPDGLTTHDIIIHHRRPNDLTFRLFTPQHHQKLPLIIFFHGGGFFLQTADSSNSHALTATLSLRLPAIVASLTYRLSPEHKYPSQHQDAHDMIRFLDAHPHLLPDNADLSNTFLAGDSAGANLAHFAAAKFSKSLHSITLKGLISIQPFFGGEERTESELRLLQGPMIPVWVTDWMWKAYLPEWADRDHAACNVSGPNAETDQLVGFPRSLVVVGGYDPLQDWQRRYCDWLRRLGKEVELLEFENGIHGFYVFPELDDTNMLYRQVSKFVYKKEQHYSE